MFNLKCLFSYFSIALCLVACGDSSDSSTASSEADIIVQSFDALTVCTSRHEGVTAYVKEDKSLYVCEDGLWRSEGASYSNDERRSSSRINSSSSRINSSSSQKRKSSSYAGNLEPSSVLTGTMIDDRDGQVYKTVKIGDQVWMAENLNYAYNVPTFREDSSSFCYANVAENCDEYGRLYLWSAALDSARVFSDDFDKYLDASIDASITIRGVCPAGWRMPNDDDWFMLVYAVGEDYASSRLRSVEGWRYGIEDGDDLYGFCALPAGRYHNNGDYDELNSGAVFWSSTKQSSKDVYDWYFDERDGAIHGYGGRGYNYGFSVRCVMD